MDWSIERVDTTDSTMDEARVRARAGAPEGTVVVAKQMSGGRGTHGRPWHAPEGGLYLSMVLRGIRDPHLLTLALGNAVAEALEVAGVEPRLKWVNDVFVGGKKVAGILVEGESTGPVIDFLIAGIGINVNGHTAALGEAAPIATTLEDELGCESCVPDLEVFLLQAVARWVQKVRDGRNEEIVAAFAQRDGLAGKRVLVMDGDERFTGTAKGIDSNGHLLVGTDKDVRAFANGSVRLA